MGKHSQDEINTVVQRYIAGEQATALAKEYNISRSTLYLWLKKYKTELAKKCTVSVKKFKKLKQKCERLEQMLKFVQNAPCSPTAPLKERLDYLSSKAGTAAAETPLNLMKHYQTAAGRNLKKRHRKMSS